MNELVLVTGGNGFVATWCIVELLSRGFRVRATLRNSSRENELRAALLRGGLAPATLERLSVVQADLLEDDGWTTAMEGCIYALHVASPLGSAAGSDDSYLGPARDGTLRVLRAASAAGVRRVVMTSAAAAARPPLGSDVTVSDETIWADASEKRFDAYRRSKILAERAAWDFMAGQSTELTTVLPTAVFGPLLSSANQGSVSIIANLLAGKPPALPAFGFVVVDVRDLAKAHVDAMLAPEAAGERFLVGGEFVWFVELATALREAMGPHGTRVPTRAMPTWVVKMLAPFIPALRSLAGEVGRRNDVNSSKARRVLGFAPRPLAETLKDTASSLGTNADAVR